MGMSFENSFVLFYILVLEYVDSKYRSVIGNLSLAVFYGNPPIHPV